MHDRWEPGIRARRARRSKRGCRVINRIEDGLLVGAEELNKLLKGARSVRDHVLLVQGHLTKRRALAFRDEDGIPSEAPASSRRNDGTVAPPSPENGLGARTSRERQDALAVGFLVLVPIQ